MTDGLDPAAEERWCDERRSEVIDYLKKERVEHGRVGEWPAWHLAPYVSIWAIESKKSPESVGWWVICGDLPTDYVLAQEVQHPRDAMRSIAESWLEQASLMARGGTHPTLRVGRPEDRSSLAPLLGARATTLLTWANDDTVWDEDAL